MTKRNILVTGGAGYIGSHTCKLLRQKGYTPIVLDNLVNGHRSFVRWGSLIVGDIEDVATLNMIFADYAPVSVIHFAAFAYVGESVNNPGKYYQNNVSGTISLLESMRRFNCRNIIFSSSCATYGIPKDLPITEDHSQSPVNPYGRCKLMVEKILNDYNAAYDLQYVSLRYFNAAGASSDGEIGEKHSPETHLIPLAIFAALGKREYLDIYGTDYPTKDGTAVRDYIHVNDLAAGHVLALEFLETEKKSEAFNLGTGHGNSVQDIINAVGQISHRDVPVTYGSRRPGDPAILVAGAEKAKQMLGWEPQFSDINAIVRSAWNWHSQKQNQPTAINYAKS